MNIKHSVKIISNEVVLDGVKQPFFKCGADLLTEIYREKHIEYPKFFKMDALSKLGFLASELVLQTDENRFAERDDRAVIFVNKSGSLCNDKHYQATINADNYFPSPALFVYTLPNIVTGEIAIRNKYYGETAFYVAESFSAKILEDIVSDAFQDSATTSVLCGWLNCESDNDFEAYVFLVDKNIKSQYN